MRVSRRRALAILPAAAVLVACHAEKARPVVNVRDFGAVGDGETDESRAIQEAVAALKPGCILRFPNGTYRFAQQYPEGAAAISIAGLSDIDIEFDIGAELVMDNLDGVTGLGTSHGILVVGPASGIVLRNVKIQWVRQAARSMGDGIRVLGSPLWEDAPPVGWDGPPAPVSDVALSNCEILRSPQAGAIFIGTSDIDIAGFRAIDTAADGLHFNACRRARIDHYLAVDNGDDGLGLVTYYAEDVSFDDASHTFAFPTLNDWSNADFTITNVYVSGGKANGVRLSGANRISIDRLNVTEKRNGSGVIVDSASSVGPDTAWRYVASRGVRLNTISVEMCEMGMHIIARPNGIADGRFTDFDVSVADAEFRGCSNWSFRAESSTKNRISGLKIHHFSADATSTTGGNGCVSLENAQNASLANASVTHSHATVLFSAVDSGELEVGRLQLRITGTDTDLLESTAKPCALFQGCDGVIDGMDVRWPKAPETWIPVLVTNDRDWADRATCVDSSAPTSIDIQTLTVDPSRATNRVVRC